MGGYDHLSASYLADAKDFQRIFSAYFPSLADFHEACLEKEWLHSRVYMNKRETVRRTKAKAELKKVINALRTLSQHDLVYWGHMSYCTWKKEDRVSQFEREIFDFIMQTLGEMNEEPGLTEEVLNKYAADAEEGINRIPEAANINWDAVFAVDALRVLWWRNTGQEGPARALNPASTFCNYLRAGFQYLEIEADPSSAFKRWAARQSEVV